MDYPPRGTQNEASWTIQKQLAGKRRVVAPHRVTNQLGFSANRVDLYGFKTILWDMKHKC
jgi:hypothetical protein